MFFDIIGIIGVFMILSVYAAVQVEKMDVKSLSYSVMNAAGAVLILISLLVTFNLASFVIEIAWLAISVFGIIQAVKRKNGDGESGGN